jgi:hypothetical protein
MLTLVTSYPFLNIVGTVLTFGVGDVDLDGDHGADRHLRPRRVAVIGCGCGEPCLACGSSEGVADAPALREAGLRVNHHGSASRDAARH